MVEENKQSSDNSEDFLPIGGKPEKASVSIRFFGDELDPNELTKLLECEPSEAYKKGYVITTTVMPRTVKTGMWFLSVERNTEQTLEEIILELLEKLTKDLKVWKKLSEQFEISIYCGAWIMGWNRDVWFNADLLTKIAERNLSIGLAIYCDGDDEEED
jgi:hypothetical protein